MAAVPDVAHRTAAKGTIQFPKGQPLPLPLVRQIVAFRAQEIGGG